MRIISRLTIPFCALLLVASLARDAAAQGFVSPFIGATLTSPSSLGGRSQPGFGIAFGSIGMIFGGEAEITYFPEVIDSQPNGLDRNHAWTFSASSMIGPRIGPVKVYGIFGVGDTLLSSTPISSLGSFSNHYFTSNAGGGLMVFFGKLGFRGDIRHFRAYGFKIADFPSSAAFDDFKFWRGTAGLAIRF